MAMTPLNERSKVINYDWIKRKGLDFERLYRVDLSGTHCASNYQCVGVAASWNPGLAMVT